MSGFLSICIFINQPVLIRFQILTHLFLKQSAFCLVSSLRYKRVCVCEWERERKNKREGWREGEREGIFISKPYLKCSKDSFEIEVFEYNKSVLPSFLPFGWFQHLLLLLLLLCLTIQLLSPLCPKASSSPTISSVFLFQIVRVCECVSVCVWGCECVCDSVCPKLFNRASNSQVEEHSLQTLVGILRNK